MIAYEIGLERPTIIGKVDISPLPGRGIMGKKRDEELDGPIDDEEEDPPDRSWASHGGGIRRAPAKKTSKRAPAKKAAKRAAAKRGRR